MAQRLAIVVDLREDVCCVSARGPGQVDGQDGAAGGARELCGRNGRGKRLAEECDGNGGGFGRTIEQECDAAVCFEPANYFDGGERVLTDSQGFDSPASAGGLAYFCQTSVWFGGGQNLQANPSLGEEWSAKLPIAEVNGHEQDAFTFGLGSLEMFPAGQAIEEIVDGETAFVPPEVSQFDRELLE